MARFQVKNPIALAAGGRPSAACEITPEGVVAAATTVVGQAPVYAAESLPAGAVVPGLHEHNIVDATAVSAAIKSVMSQVQPRLKSLSLIVPDAAVRVFVLDFDQFPTRQDEVLPVLRFRLRKSVPFDVEHAGISYQVLTEGSARFETQWKILAAIMPGPVLAEYEAVVRGAGYEPGAVLPASLAMLPALSGMESQEAVLTANLSVRSLTTAIVAGNNVLLYRTVELPAASDPQGAELMQAELQRSIAVSAAFFEDTLQVRPHRLLCSGVLSAGEFAELLNDPAMAVGEVVPRSSMGMTSSMGRHPVASVTGALVGTN